MTPLIDMDILCHELGWSSQFKDKETGEDILFDFEKVSEMLDEKIRLICLDVDATEEPILFMTNSESVTKRVNKLRAWQEEELIEFVPNFRYEAAKTKPYKGTRKNPKPFHFYNIIAYLMANYDVRISEDGLEADDMICIEQIKNAKKFGCKIDTHAGPILVDYEDWLKYSRTTFIKEKNGYFINDTGKGDSRKTWSLHREIMGNPDGVVDHINGDKSDNRKYNLRVCSTKENIRNSKSQEGTSRFKGVSFDKTRRKWVSSIKVDRQSKFLGRFDSEEDAAKVYDTAARKFFGEFARLNLEEPYVKPFKQTIICSRDKDLRICPLYHFSWECGNQRAVGPTKTDELGWLEKHEEYDEETGKLKKRKIFGYGLSFFYFQMLTGDTADNIPGLPKWGEVKAYNLLSELKTKEELFKAVKTAYKETMGDKAKEYFIEMASLLWMIQEKGKSFEL